MVQKHEAWSLEATPPHHGGGAQGAQPRMELPSPRDSVSPQPQPTRTLSFREGHDREVATVPIQQLTSLIPLDSKRQILAVPRDQVPTSQRLLMPTYPPV